MFASAVVVLAAGFSGLASAQSTNSTGSAVNYPYLISPNDPAITQQDRAQWCSAQYNSCRQLCGGAANPNRCDGQTLTYSCGCQDGTTPNVTAYQQTLPFFECLIYVDNCVNATDDAQTQDNCRAIKCGASGDPAAVQSSITAAMAATATPSQSASQSTPTAATTSGAGQGAGQVNPTTSTHSGLAPAMTVAASYGTGALAAGAIALFGFAL